MVRYFDDKVCYIDDEISYIFMLAFLWRVCVGGYYGWVGSGGVLYRFCSVSIIVSSLSFCCAVLRNLLQGWCVPGSLDIDMLHSVGVKRKTRGLRAMCISVGVARMSIYGLHRVLTCETVLILS
jgi:hypothetical protein